MKIKVKENYGNTFITTHKGNIIYNNKWFVYEGNDKEIEHLLKQNVFDIEEELSDNEKKVFEIKQKQIVKEKESKENKMKEMVEEEIKEKPLKVENNKSITEKTEISSLAEKKIESIKEPKQN